MKKNLFWIVIPTVCLLSLVAWFLATSSMSKDFKTQTSDINKAWSKMRNIGSMEDIPNEDTSKAMQQNITKRRDIVTKAWRRRVIDQTGGIAEERILVWPKELGEAFIAQVEKLYPIEKTVTFGGEEILDADSRREYRNYITMELPKLARRIGAEWKKDTNVSASPDEGVRDDEAEGPVVYWNGRNQEEIEKEHFNWDWKEVDKFPTTLHIQSH